MGVRVIRDHNKAELEKNPIFDAGFTQEQRETTVDGQTFHWAPGQVRNFLDQGVGAAHAAFGQGLSSVIHENMIPFGSSRF